MHKLHNTRGFTLIEVLTAVAIILILLTILGAYVLKLKEDVKETACKILIGRIASTMDEFKALNREYPAEVDGDGRLKETFPETDPYQKDLTPQVKATAELWKDDARPANALPLRFLKNQLSSLLTAPAGFKVKSGEIHPEDEDYLQDPWGNYIRYRKVGRNRMLVWSNGRNGKIEIGVGQEWDEDSSSYVGDENMRSVSVGDDISSENIRDYAKGRQEKKESD